MAEKKEDIELVGFEKILEVLKKKKYAKATRLTWFKTGCPIVMIQRPDANSFMTEPYLYIEKIVNDELKRFPLSLSSESLLANDWLFIREE